MFKGTNLICVGLLFALSLAFAEEPLHSRLDITKNSMRTKTTDKIQCIEVERYGKNKENIHSICEVPVIGGGTKKLHTLKLDGNFKEISRAQGYLLAKETDNGVLSEAGPLIADALSKAPPELRAFISCLVNLMENSVSTEFKDGVMAFYDGYQERATLEDINNGPWKPFLRDVTKTKGINSKLIFKLLAYGIELENVTDALKHSIIDNPLVKRFSEKKLSALSLKEYPNDKENLKKVISYFKDVLNSCGNDIGQELRNRLNGYLHQGELAFLEHLKGDNFITQYLKFYGKIGNKKIGCTGFISPTSTSEVNKEGEPQFIHARNLDADTVKSWNREPTLFIVNEKDPNGKPYAKYVAPGTAGMFYTGGVGGMNEHGITTSLHQMYTNTFKLSFPNGTADIGPFTNQKVLRGSKDIHEARKIIEGIKHYGAWTELIGDSKSNDGISIEMSAAGVGIAQGRWLHDQHMPQSNHFLSSIKDSAYTPYFNKHLESRGRFNVVDEMIKAKKVDVDYAIKILSNHKDFYEGGERSFGRTAAKAYGVMSNIMIPNKRSPDGKSDRAEFWMTMGEDTRDPNAPHTTASHTTFVGFDVNWSEGTLTPIQNTKRNSEWDHLPNWTESLATYITARETYKAGDKKKALELLSKAIEQSEKDFPSDKTPSKDIRQLPYYFMRARLLNEMGEYQKSYRDWEYLWSKYTYLGDKFPHAYQRALVAMYLVGNRAQMAGNSFEPNLIDNYRIQLALKILNSRSGDGADHYDLQLKIDYANSILKNPKKVDSPPTPLDFVFIE